MRAASRPGAAEVAAYCGSKPGATATRPFGPEPLVFKVSGKMFALLGQRHGQAVVSLKCEPDRAALLRASFPAITQGYHLNKEHWNTLALDGSLPPPLIAELVDHSYELVTASRRARGSPRRKPAKK